MLMNLPVSALAAGTWISETALANLQTVTYVLLAIFAVIGIIYFVRHMADGKAEPAEPVSTSTPAPVPAPIVKAEKAVSASAPAAAPAVDDGALVAVLTAAVAAILADEAAANGTQMRPFRVVSFRHTGRGRGWNGNY